jgi:hypothetical protein
MFTSVLLLGGSARFIASPLTFIRARVWLSEARRAWSRDAEWRVRSRWRPAGSFLGGRLRKRRQFADTSHGIGGNDGGTGEQASLGAHLAKMHSCRLLCRSAPIRWTRQKGKPQKGPEPQTPNSRPRSALSNNRTSYRVHEIDGVRWRRTHSVNFPAKKSIAPCAFCRSSAIKNEPRECG